MAQSGPRAAYAFPAEVARFLEVTPQDVRRMVELDGLPATRVPKKCRVALRIYLPDLHAWLVGRSGGAMGKLRNYEEFRAIFRETVDGGREAARADA